MATISNGDPRVQELTVEIAILKTKLDERDKALQKLNIDHEKHFADLNNSHALARKALTDADLKLTNYTTKETFEAVIKEMGARLEKTETAVLRMSDLIVVSKSMEARLASLESWKDKVGAVTQKSDEISKAAWGVIGMVIGGVIIGLVMLLVTRGLT